MVDGELSTPSQALLPRHRRALRDGQVSYALVVFVTALAIFDDIGGILVIALFDGAALQATGLAAAGAAAAALAVTSRAGRLGAARRGEGRHPRRLARGRRDGAVVLALTARSHE